MAAAAGATLAAAHRVVDRVHGDTAVVRPLAQPPRAAGFADGDVGVVDVRHLADRRVAAKVNLPNFAAGEANLGVVAVLGHEDASGAGGAHQLTALALLHLDVVDGRA